MESNGCVCAGWVCPLGKCSREWRVWRVIPGCSTDGSSSLLHRLCHSCGCGPPPDPTRYPQYSMEPSPTVRRRPYPMSPTATDTYFAYNLCQTARQFLPERKRQMLLAEQSSATITLLIPKKVSFCDVLDRFFEIFQHLWLIDWVISCE